jgi:hypothetical protein
VASSTFDAPKGIAVVQARVPEPLAGETLYRIALFVSFNFNSHEKERAFVENLFVRRGGSKNDHVERKLNFLVALLN